MKKIYIVPETQVSLMMGERVLTTDSYGHTPGEEALSKKNDFFWDDDEFGDTWGDDSNNLWGDED